MKGSELNEQDLEFLCKHINFLRSLSAGQRPPTTDAQRHFCAVCNGEEEPTTAYEAAFVKWLVAKPSVREMERRLATLREARLQKSRVERAKEHRFPRHVPEGTRREIEQRYLSHGRMNDGARTEELVRREKERQAKAEERRAKEPQRPKKDFTPRFIEETWGTRAAWRKDSGRNKYNGR